MKYKFIDIFGIKINILSYPQIITLIDEFIKSKEILNILNINSYIVISASKDSSLKNILNNEIFCLPDGVGIYFASKVLYRGIEIKEVITGTDLYYKILNYSEENKLKVFFLGGSDKSSELIEEKIKISYPDISFSGVINRNKYKELDSVKFINNANPNIVFIGLGTPEQEYWMKINNDKLLKCVRICCGSGIEFISGAKPRAPLWMREIGLEWLFRLLLEPKRLWKRYLIGIPHFIIRIIALKFKSNEKQ